MSAVVATQGQSGVHVSSDGQVSVSREVTLTAAELDDQGNFSLRVIRARTRQVVGQVSSVFAITGHGETAASTSYTEDDGDEISLSKKICIWVCSLIFGSLPVAMIVVGILDYNLCPGDTRLGIYMVTQGATSVAIPILCSLWYCCQCVSATLLLACCCIIFLFNIGWGITGTVWIYVSTCKDSLLYTHAVGFSVPMWVVFCVIGIPLCCCIYSWCCGGDDN
ncbi:uncharacterized protein LOC125374035 isoform X1 [Haliotis rufescens]|uniref:uncharacterized protein LOC125374035 isoform X1 n=1 Tax=Haliotis rufescens TaxID=6454 RepID=UPI00201F18F3|nr:uncharacterized protein LOC125374035 isoform X1 [Haliotis rufescens]